MPDSFFWIHLLFTIQRDELKCFYTKTNEPQYKAAICIDCPFLHKAQKQVEKQQSVLKLSEDFARIIECSCGSCLILSFGGLRNCLISRLRVLGLGFFLLCHDMIIFSLIFNF